MTRQNIQQTYRLLIVVLAYFVTGKLGLLVPYVGSNITLIWLPSGISVAALLCWGYRYWPAILLGGLAVNLTSDLPPELAIIISTVCTLAPLLTAWMLNIFKFRIQLKRLRDMLWLIISACIGMTISASGGVAGLVYFGTDGIHDWHLPWLIWWLGDTLGVLLALPILLSISSYELKRLWQQRAQYLTCCAIVFIAELAILQLVHSTSGQFALLAFMVLPLVIWAAMRFSMLGAALLVLGLSIIAVISTAHSIGPFYQSDVNQGILSLWVFMSTLAMVVLMISVLQAERVATELALRGSEARFRAVVDGALDAVVTIDESGCLVEFNPAAERIFGYTRQQVIGRPLSEVIIPPSMRSAHTKGHQNFLQTGEQKIFDQRVEMVAMRADGSEFPVELTITSLKDKGLPLVTGFIRDITKRKKAEENIHNLAFFDPLTGLPNRRLLLDRLQQAFATSARAHTHGAMLFIDLDNFKALNDSRGHDVGDLLLIEVTQRLRITVRDEDTVSRLGGDEFVVLLEGLNANVAQAAAEARSVGEKLLEEIDKPYQLQGIEHHSSSSIGMCLFSGNDVNIDELFKRADTAMYEAKAAGRNTLRFFDPAMQVAIEHRVKLESQLRRAIAEQQFSLHYQVQVDADRNIFGVEALLRWHHPLGAIVSPGEFIWAAEENGLIIPIGRWVIHQACEQIKRWEALPYASKIQLAVNVSARQFKQVDFVEIIRGCLEFTGINPGLLKLELTESLIMEDIDNTIEKMQAIRAMGVRFSMDDFGTGYSSLAYLKTLPLTQIKIDQSFVSDIATDANDATIVQTIIVMSRTLGLNVIAEGVETEEQFALLKHYGCTQFQGFLFRQPVPLETLDQLLQSGKS